MVQELIEPEATAHIGPHRQLLAALDEPLTAFRTRPLDHVRFPYAYLDATSCATSST